MNKKIKLSTGELVLVVVLSIGVIIAWVGLGVILENDVPIEAPKEIYRFQSDTLIIPEKVMTIKSNGDSTIKYIYVFYE